MWLKNMKICHNFTNSQIKHQLCLPLFSYSIWDDFFFKNLVRTCQNENSQNCRKDYKFIKPFWKVNRWNVLKFIWNRIGLSAPLLELQPEGSIPYIVQEGLLNWNFTVILLLFKTSHGFSLFTEWRWKSWIMSILCCSTLACAYLSHLFSHHSLSCPFKSSHMSLSSVPRCILLLLI